MIGIVMFSISCSEIFPFFSAQSIVFISIFPIYQKWNARKISLKLDLARGGFETSIHLIDFAKEWPQLHCFYAIVNCRIKGAYIKYAEGVPVSFTNFSENISLSREP